MNVRYVICCSYMNAKLVNCSEQKHRTDFKLDNLVGANCLQYASMIGWDLVHTRSVGLATFRSSIRISADFP
jgi:hypothetical protein